MQTVIHEVIQFKFQKGRDRLTLFIGNAYQAGLAVATAAATLALETQTFIEEIGPLAQGFNQFVIHARIWAQRDSQSQPQKFRSAKK